MPGIIGRKVGMTRVFSDEGRSIPVTVIEAGPCVVTQVKHVDTDGYEAIQLAYGDKKEKNTPKPMLHHFKKTNTKPKAFLAEFRDFMQEFEELGEPGKVINVQDVFAEGDWLDVVGTSKGKGFQGVVKRHGFSGVGGQTHGQHNRLRAPGSIGNASYAARVVKGKKMAGRMGGKRVKALNLKVVKIYPDENIILVSGAVPGAKNSTVILEK